MTWWACEAIVAARHLAGSTIVAMSGPDDLTALVSGLSDAIELLERFGDEHWARWLRTSLAQIQSGDAHGLAHLLGAYGGMGSINDFSLPDVSSTVRLHELLGQNFVLAERLLRLV